MLLDLQSDAAVRKMDDSTLFAGLLYSYGVVVVSQYEYS